ncbi:hypothetical protein RJ640_003402 [Escallonia rubra]|uniref:Uncharacterized protein n=1 Tax=Escallonia rubra TaxID=112253 RepID=A0AA88RLL5_9ASTE|nr:hypothetical protein RJ640_003402 [Escallonia rubra]
MHRENLMVDVICFLCMEKNLLKSHGRCDLHPLHGEEPVVSILRSQGPCLRFAVTGACRPGQARGTLFEHYVP